VHRKYTLYGAGAICAASVLLVAALATNQAFGRSRVTPARQVTLSAQAQMLRVYGVHTVDMRSVPDTRAAAAYATGKVPRHLPYLEGRSGKTRAQLKHARANANAPRPTDGAQTAVSAGSSAGAVGPKTPYAGTGFKGLDDGCNIATGGSPLEPPDLAVAASSSWVLEAVNDCLAVYTTAGVVQAGFPKSAIAFFGVPKPTPAGCDAAPFMSDPRAAYDPNDQRFWVSWLQVEGAFDLNGYAEVSRDWIAVSRTSDPRGAWNVFSVNMLGGVSATDAADFDQLGFDA
jgi:hypothetical protein